MIRVTGGLFRGTLLYCPKNIRPSSAKIKEYIFSQVGPYIIGGRVLDLFAGSGALGIEALSRHAREAVFVDKARNAILSLEKNLQKLHLEGKIIRADALHFVENYQGEPFDLICLDPPYEKFYPQILLSALEKSNLLNPGGHVVFEMMADTPEPETETLLLSSFRTLGDTSIGIWFKQG
jgi:16S rRNA (guanine966-N2)-methyltransferase